MEAYTRALRSARKLVYLESQFLWSPQVVEILAGKLREPPERGLPRGRAAARQAEQRRRHDAWPAGGPGRAPTTAPVAFWPRRSRPAAERLTGPLYVHAKIGIVDDAWLTVGSANLNEHSFFNDTEMNIVTCDPRLARETRLRLWSEHLERSVEEVSGEPARVIDELWRPIAREQLERRQSRRAPDPSAARASRASRAARWRCSDRFDSLFVDG